MLRGFYKCVILIILSSSLPSACTARPATTLAPRAATETMQAAATLIAKSEQTPATSTLITLEISTPEATRTPTNTPTSNIVHIDFPRQPPAHTSKLSDRSSAPLADENRAIGDSLDRNILERPFAVDEMQYQPHLDIAPGAELSLAPPWVYVSIFLEAAPPAGEEATYAVELDLNLDGRGDWLIMASTPLSETWSTQGVRAYLDSNGDVGGEIPTYAETPPQDGDGYEVLLFDEGTGFDTDAVFSRIVLEPRPTVQMAIKHTLIARDKTLVWGVWTFGIQVHPEWFEYNDHYTLKEAGSPISTNLNYPLKELSSVDSTCRWVQGIVPRRDMPSLCGYQP